MYRLFIFYIVTLLMALATPAMAIPYSQTITWPVGTTVSGNPGTFSWSHSLPADFEIPYDTINSASLVISTKRATGSNDILSIVGPYSLVLGPVAGVANPNTVTQTTFTIPVNFFTTGWTNGDQLDLLFSISNVFNITMVQSVLTIDYTNGSEPTPPVPEPATALLVGFGLAGVALARKRRRSG